ncbi:hypothetical protein P153DRAFT_354245 [Dothidotthia symphoricarpi CBS 119687]|uniref:DUF7707 domain-containing protein n=1 Tax=Dothidotthia symphoricarpi CBS 119687 TaxID=1392245 RepID=A0A6A6ALE7_9PLEO|nr:uncharacterized protein P153DRAFT_354245 [Dothidotthia symphoricarpi CBS 119687]KAF2132779.1 hypothetical protein P153DRAFT_354245 [Dothidotthia symphoricarpi CBS 119687]
MRSVSALSFAAFVGFAAAQQQYTIDPDSVSSSDRSYWCNQQIAMCPLICTQQPGVDTLTTQSNDCDPDTLTYDCVCDGGITPNITQYSQTLPFFICQTWGNQCVANCNGASSCQDACRADHPCGAQTPYLGNASASALLSASASRTGSAASSSIPVTGFGGAASTSAASGAQGAVSAPYIPGATMGMAALFGSVFLGFAVLL